MPWELEDPEYLSISSESEEGDGFGPNPALTLWKSDAYDKAPKSLPPFQYVNKI
jgi:hypothetical protein